MVLLVGQLLALLCLLGIVVLYRRDRLRRVFCCLLVVFTACYVLWLLIVL